MSSEDLDQIIIKLRRLENDVKWILKKVSNFEYRIEELEESVTSSVSINTSSIQLENNQFNFTKKPDATLLGINPGSGKYCFIIPKVFK